MYFKDDGYSVGKKMRSKPCKPLCESAQGAVLSHKMDGKQKFKKNFQEKCGHFALSLIKYYGCNYL